MSTCKNTGLFVCITQLKNTVPTPNLFFLFQFVDDNYEDPDDVAAIQEAQNNMGDYKLKTADDYVVPDHLRMNVEKAIMKLLVLKELVSDWLILVHQFLLPTFHTL